MVNQNKIFSFEIKHQQKRLSEWCRNYSNIVITLLEKRELCFSLCLMFCLTCLLAHPFGAIGRLFHPTYSDRQACVNSVALRKHAYIQIYWKITTKKWNFQIKKSDILHISAQNIDCGYSLEPPRRGGSNEYPQSMFLSRNKKNIMCTHVNPSGVYGGQNYIGMFSWCSSDAVKSDSDQDLHYLLIIQQS